MDLSNIGNINGLYQDDYLFASPALAARLDEAQHSRSLRLAERSCHHRGDVQGFEV